MSKILEEFLKESNAIEGVHDIQSLGHAMSAWRYISKHKELTVRNILETHRIIARHSDLPKEAIGHFRKQPVWVGGREGRKWQALSYSVQVWSERATTAKTEEQIKLDHIDYEQIHPFIDFNGRTGRIFMNWQRVKNKFPILVIKASERQKYYKWFKE